MTTVLLALLIASAIVNVFMHKHYKNRYDKRSQLLYMSLSQAGELSDRLLKTKALLKGMK